MKQLETNFVKNVDKSGNNRFIQLRKDGSTAMYRRETMEGHTVGFEVFNFKTIVAGSSLPGGGTVEETYESYPGGKAFGRVAWFIGGHQAEQRANERFNSLSHGVIKVENVDEVETEEMSITVVKVSKMRTERPKLNFPPKPFTQKELAAFNNIENYKEVYTDLQRFLTDGILRKGEKRESTRGKSAQLFEVVEVTEVVTI